MCGDSCEVPDECSGPECPTVALSSCHMAGTPCFAPTSCDCVTQCHAFAFLYRETCFNGRSWVNVSQEDGLVHIGNESVKVDHEKASNCHLRCSKRGYCHLDESGHAICRCAWGHGGRSCESDMRNSPFRCPNDCSGVGRCSHGTCHCSVGHFGIDCSLYMDQRGNQRILERPPLPWLRHPQSNDSALTKLDLRIFVYELPGHLNSWQMQHSVSGGSPESAMFLERLLASPYRTADPNEAHYFFIPLFLGSRGGSYVATLDKAIDYIKKNFPGRWQRLDGQDHILVIDTPHGLCDFHPAPSRHHRQLAAPLDSLIAITLWRGQRLSNSVNRNSTIDSPSCFRRGHDILVPPVPNPESLALSPYLSASNRQNRSTLLYCDGFIEPGHKGSVTAKVRGRMRSLYRGSGGPESGVYVELDPLDVGSKVRRMGRFKYCIVSDPDVDFTLAMLAGCVPIFVPADKFHPFDGDFSDFSELGLSLELIHLSQIESILSEIPEGYFEQSQAVMAKLWTRFVWVSPSRNPLAGHLHSIQRKWSQVLAENDVFSTVMQALVARLSTRDAGVEEVKSKVVRASRCGEKCFLHGSCNEEIGRCECVVNRVGPQCEFRAFPSCEFELDGDTYVAPCSMKTTCACAEECLALRFGSTYSYGPNHRPLCYDETRWMRNGSHAGRMKIHDVFDLPEVQLIVNDEWKVTGKEPATNTDEWVPIWNCPNNCSYGGGCKNVSGELGCVCSWLFEGEICDGSASTVTCLNGCSRRGKCIAGSCHCIKGFFGIDCSISLDEKGQPTLLKRPPLSWVKGAQVFNNYGPWVYVYEIPQYMNSWQAVNSIELDWMEAFVFTERLLSSHYRTPDPDRADFFYIPLILRNRLGMRLPVFQEAVSFIRSTWPKYWNRSNGRDHFVIVNDDWGVCESDQYGFGPPEFDAVMVLSLWGHTLNSALGRDHPCFVPGKDIVIPPIMNSYVYPHIIHIAGREKKFLNRTIFAYFRGFSGHDSDWFHNYTWSFGVRQAIFDIFAGDEANTGVRLEETQMYGHVWNFLESMERSVFCLAPAGWGWGMRTTQSVLLGCIPVVIQPNVVQPFEGDLLNWNDFAVTLRVQDIPMISKILHYLPKTVLDAKRRSGQSVWPRFLWTSSSYNPLTEFPEKVQQQWGKVLLTRDAFSSVMDVLAARLRNKHSPESWLGGASIDKLKFCDYTNKVK